MSAKRRSRIDRVMGSGLLTLAGTRLHVCGNGGYRIGPVLTVAAFAAALLSSPVDRRFRCGRLKAWSTTSSGLFVGLYEQILER
jgi:hypothetical protein